MSGPGRQAIEAARQGVALAPEIAAELVDLVGEDRLRFANNLCTADVRALAPGESARGFVTSVQGKVVASVSLVGLEGRLRLVLPPGSAAPVAEHFGRYRIVERVEIVPRANLELAGVRGPGAAELLRAAGLPAPEAAGAHHVEGAGELEVRVRRLLLGREPRFELSGARPALELALERLRAAGAPPTLGEAELELLRIEDGEARFGVDYSEESFPQETGDEAAVSYTKGCYLGQEVVARIHYRGGVQRSLRGLRFPERMPSPGEALLVEGREAGRATSVVRSARFGPIGLGLVHRRADPPARLELAGGGAVELVPLPFA